MGRLWWWGQGGPGPFEQTDCSGDVFREDALGRAGWREREQWGLCRQGVGNCNLVRGQGRWDGWGWRPWGSFGGSWPSGWFTETG